MAFAINVTKAVTSQNKVFIAGEIGFAANASVVQQAFYEPFLNTSGTGSLLWSFRPLGYNGGYVVHSEGGGIFSYHAPGLNPPLDTGNFDYREPVRTTFDLKLFD